MKHTLLGLGLTVEMLADGADRGEASRDLPVVQKRPLAYGSPLTGMSSRGSRPATTGSLCTPV